MRTHRGDTIDKKVVEKCELRIVGGYGWEAHRAEAWKGVSCEGS